jgi:spermidine synthase
MLAACLFASGLGSLVLEVVWTRQLRLVFGSTTLAASTILVAYMLGLGLGGIAGGRLSRRIRDGVRTYGWMEIAIGLYALLVPAALLRMNDLNRTLLYGLDFWPAALCRFAIALVILLLPTFLMGATLPILVAAASRVDPRVGRHTSLLYGVNTIGAVAGVFLANFALFEWLGIAAASRFGALVDAAVGLVALVWLAPWARRAMAAAGDAAAPTAPLRETDAATLASATPLLVVYALVGFTALVYEVAWTRALSMVLGGSIHGFAVMLGAFLAGIGLGSLAMRPLVERVRQPVRVFANGVALLGLLAFASTAFLSSLPDLALAFAERWGVAGAAMTTLQISVATLLMLPTTLVLGALMPLLSRVIAECWTSAGDAVGRVYFANTLGSAAGAFLAGFVLIPTIGLRATIVFAAVADVAAAAFLMSRLRTSPRRAAVLAAVAVALVLIPMPFDREALTRGVFRRPELEMSFGIELEPYEGVEKERLLYYRDGITGTVSVHEGDGTRVLKVNGKADASNGLDVPTQVMLGQVPLLFGPPARSALVIGFASGMTVGSVITHPELERIDVVEIEPAMVEASRYFDDENGRPLSDPRVRLISDDARAYLSGTSEKYDVIVSEPSNPWLTGVANLFTREFFQSARSALGPDGRLLQWVHLYGMDGRALASILAALRSEFSHVYGFAHFSGWPDLLLLAMNRSLAEPDLPRWSDLPEPVRRDLMRIGNFSEADLLSSIRLLPADIDRLYGPGDPINTDDNLLVELTTPWLVNARTLDEQWQRFAVGNQGVLPLVDALRGPQSADAVAELALAYASLRRDLLVSQRLVAVAEQRGKSATTIAAALSVARQIDEELANADQLATLDDALGRSRNSFGTWLLRAQVHLEADDYLAGLEDLNEAFRLRPGDVRARILRTRLLAATRKRGEALREIDDLVAGGYARLEPDLPKERASLLLSGRRNAEAVAALDSLLYEGDPSWPEGWMMLASAERDSGDAAAAERAMKNHEVARRNQPRWFHQQARRALWAGQRVDAAYLLGLTVGLAPENEEAKLELAQLEAKPGFAPEMSRGSAQGAKQTGTGLPPQTPLQQLPQPESAGYPSGKQSPQ